MDVTHFANTISVSDRLLCVPQQVRSISWHHTKETVTVLNVDGSSIGNPGRSGFSDLLRRSDGEWIIGFARNLGISEILQAKLMAIYKGLLLSWELGFRNLICYSDSQMALDLINEKRNRLHVYAALIQSIKEVLLKDWTVRLIHCWREGNVAADLLAKFGAQSVLPWTTFATPGVVDVLESTLALDASGTEFF